MNGQRLSGLNPEIIDDYSGRYIERFAEEVRAARVREFMRGIGEWGGYVLLCGVCAATVWLGFAL